MAPIDTTPFTPIPSRVNKLSRAAHKRRVDADVVEDHVKRPRLAEDLEAASESGVRGGMSSYRHGYMGGLGNGSAVNGSGPKVVEVALANGGSTSSSKYPSSTASSVSGVTSASLSSKSPSIASLCNLGNTCFLNSVLYTLRFTPGFLHNLHHMVYDLTQHNGNGSHGKKRNGFSNGHVDAESDGEMVQEVIEQLHDLFKSLSCADDSGDSREPIPPSNFLNAVGKLNPMFEGNQQQDAHELLVMILNILEDIKIPAALPEPQPLQEKNGEASSFLPPISDKKMKKKPGRSSQNGGNITMIQNGINSRSSPSLTSTVSLPQTPVMLPNFVRENFEGKAVMRTRCLECEMSTYRSETFTFIDVPLHLDDDDDELSGKELFFKQILMSETLRENNKYWCEECSRLNEAQRSVEYELLPKVMVLQLKRFTATGSKFMSKINDFIPTPFSMNCFCTQCMPSTRQQSIPPKHHYRLYAVIMHLGATLASGHYIAYVRASPDAMWDYSQCQRVSTVERNKNKKGIMKFLRRSNNGDSNGGTNGSEVGATSSCRSANCCGVRGGFVSNYLDASTTLQRSVESSDSQEGNSTSSASSLAADESREPDDLWLECDDESIQVITRKQFEEILSAKQGATTPYLLFYQKV